MSDNEPCLCATRADGMISQYHLSCPWPGHPQSARRAGTQLVQEALAASPRPLTLAATPDVKTDFLHAARASGMQEPVCVQCGMLWLSRRAATLCPCCDPEHPGYEPHDLEQRKARWLAFWREQLLDLLVHRAINEWHDTAHLSRVLLPHFLRWASQP